MRDKRILFGLNFGQLKLLREDSCQILEFAPSITVLVFTATLAVVLEKFSLGVAREQLVYRVIAEHGTDGRRD